MTRPRVKFVRPSGLGALPRPKRARGRDAVRALADLLGLKRRALMRVIGWLLSCLMPNGSYPVLVLSGVQGSGKSHTTRKLRWLVDPNEAETRSAPKSERDLLIAARNGWILAFDNLSEIDQDLSDAMCRVATRAGFGTRTPYTNLDETLVSVRRPQVINGISDLATAADLLDRAVMVTLPTRPDGHILDERELWWRFDTAAPVILGGLLDAVATALRRRDGVKLAGRPRMADFATWVEAAAPALGWSEGAFVTEYLRNREAATRLAVEADPVGLLIVALMAGRREWRGAAKELLNEPRAKAGDGAPPLGPAAASRAGPAAAGVGGGAHAHADRTLDHDPAGARGGRVSATKTVGRRVW